MSWLSRTNLLFALSALMILVIPWYASGKSAMSLLLLEILGGIQLLVLCLGHSRSSAYGLGWSVWLFLLLLVFGTAAHLIPLSFEQWSALPGRERFMPAIEWLQKQNTQPKLSVSLVSERTISSLILLTALISLFISVSMQTNKSKKHLIILLLMIATVEATLGSIQFSTNSGSWYFFDSSHTIKADNATGTYLNRDHFVALMYMMIPVIIALICHHFTELHSRSESVQNSTTKLLSLSLILILLISAAFFSRSRAGMSLTILSIIVSFALFAKQVGNWQKMGCLAATVVMALASTMSAGIFSALNRFITLNPFEDSRWEIFNHTILGIKAFWPTGSGIGTFQEVYATMQPVEQANFINHVHNDYLELLFEMGAIGVIILFFALLIYLKSWLSLRKLQWTEMKFIRAATGISLLLLLLHELVDFNLHTPCNQVVFVVFCAIFCSKSTKIDE